MHLITTFRPSRACHGRLGTWISEVSVPKIHLPASNPEMKICQNFVRGCYRARRKPSPLQWSRSHMGLLLFCVNRTSINRLADRQQLFLTHLVHVLRWQKFVDWPNLATTKRSLCCWYKAFPTRHHPSSIMQSPFTFQCIDKQTKHCSPLPGFPPWSFCNSPTTDFKCGKAARKRSKSW